jgi:integrase
MASKSMSTEAAYRRRVIQLRRQASVWLGREPSGNVTPSQLVDYLVSRRMASQTLDGLAETRSLDKLRRNALERHAISKASWRQYRAALLFVLGEEQFATGNKPMATELEAAIVRLLEESQAGCLKRTRRTSGQKRKAFPTQDFETILRYLESQIGVQRHANTLRIWLLASRLVGVRPSEWRTGGLIEVDGTPAFRVRNAKTTNGRGNGTDRVLRLTGASPEDVEHIDDMLYMLVEFEKESGYRFERHLRQLGDYMGTVTRRCLGKRASYPTLYSLRHQFAADAKNSYTQAEVAALMGHGVDVTATIHYGRRASGQGTVKVAPLPAQVATVRNHLKASSRVRSARLGWNPSSS